MNRLINVDFPVPVSYTHLAPAKLRHIFCCERSCIISDPDHVCNPFDLSHSSSQLFMPSADEQVKPSDEECSSHNVAHGSGEKVPQQVCLPCYLRCGTHCKEARRYSEHIRYAIFQPEGGKCHNRQMAYYGPVSYTHLDTLPLLTVAASCKGSYFE